MNVKSRNVFNWLVGWLGGKGEVLVWGFLGLFFFVCLGFVWKFFCLVGWVFLGWGCVWVFFIFFTLLFCLAQLSLAPPQHGLCCSVSLSEDVLEGELIIDLISGRRQD